MELRSINIAMDDREKSDLIYGKLNVSPGITLEVKRLAVGDYAIENHLLIERKTLRDFANSIVDGRLFHQGKRLMEAPQQSVLILEGRGVTLNGHGIRREAIQGAMITLSIFFGIPILRARDAEESARLIIYTGQQNNTIVNGAVPRPGYRPKGKRRTQLYILQSLPGVGVARARLLLERFGTIEAVLSASADELMETEGIGETTAKNIGWAVREANSSVYRAGI